MENSQGKLQMEDNQLSVVLAVYNGEKYLQRLLDSVLAQTGITLKELIIVDDKSTDGSAAIIKTYQDKNSNITILTNEVNLGPIGSFIKGAKSAASAYIAFADQDDIWVSDKLHLSLSRLKQIDEDGKPAVVFTDLAMIDETGNPLQPSFWELYQISPASNNFFTVLFANIATGCTMLINRKMLEEFVKMPVDAAMHDHWILLIAMSTGRWDYLSEQTIQYRVHGNSVTNKNKVTIKEKIFNFVRASLSNAPDFLTASIDQAILFDTVYGTKLNDKERRQLNYFVKLSNASGFWRKINSKLRFRIYKWL